MVGDWYANSEGDICKVEKILGNIVWGLLARGTQAEANRLKEVLSNCCCYVCHNRGCETPIEGKQDCKHECDLYGKVFCEKKEE